MSKDIPQQPNSPDKIDRRKFIGVAAATAGAMFIRPALVHGTAANSAVRVGLLGCGGRGTEDASNLVDTGGARVVALGDLFRDQLDAARAHFDKMQQAKGYAAIDASQLFAGPNAYQQIAASKELDAIDSRFATARLSSKWSGASMTGQSVRLSAEKLTILPGTSTDQRGQTPHQSSIACAIGCTIVFSPVTSSWNKTFT